MCPKVLECGQSSAALASIGWSDQRFECGFRNGECGIRTTKRSSFNSAFRTPPSALKERGGLFSVALSVGMPLGIVSRVYPEVMLCPPKRDRQPRVTRHRALWCSDFPPPRETRESDPPPFQNRRQYTGTRTERQAERNPNPEGRHPKEMRNPKSEPLSWTSWQTNGGMRIVKPQKP